jgi:hypothetical protein
LADNNFRSYRGRQTPAPERAGAAASGGNDPLAELARLIGQSDPYAERQYDAQARRQAADEATPPGADWPEEDEIERAHAAEEHYPQESAAAAPAHQDYAADPEDYEPEQSVPESYYSGPSGTYGGYRQGADPRSLREQRQSAGSRSVPDFLTSGPHEGAEFAEPEHDAGETYAHEDYYQPSRRRRGGLVVVMAVLGLAVVGTAGAFGYRTMFGGSLLPALPPIIKASSAPNKVLPNSGDAQAANASQAGSTNTASAENVVSREEEPINIEQAKPAPRVVSTIPVTSGESPPLPPSVVAAITPSAASPAPAAAPASPPSAAPKWPPAPGPSAPVATAPVAPSPPVNSAAAPPSPPPEPKKIHTVTIRPDQAGGGEAAAHAAARGARVSTPEGNAPLALVPGAGEAATSASPRSRRSAPPTALASAATGNAGQAEAPSPAAGYAVQVSSQHSETEAQSSFQALRAKYPDLLGKREPIIRRADLGSKGIYYRALVGPFASAEEAAAMCSSLKAAGGNCIVQKN